jgi:hypothetical protein
MLIILETLLDDTLNAIKLIIWYIEGLNIVRNLRKVNKHTTTMVFFRFSNIVDC